MSNILNWPKEVIQELRMMIMELHAIITKISSKALAEEVAKRSVMMTEEANCSPLHFWRLTYEYPIPP